MFYLTRLLLFLDFDICLFDFLKQTLSALVKWAFVWDIRRNSFSNSSIRERRWSVLEL